MINISRLWYVTTAVHFWRFYFRYENKDPSNFSEPDALNWNACKRARSKFTDEEVNILRQYYLTSYGNYEDMKAIEEYAIQNGISKKYAWDTIKKANYEVIIERGLMNRNEGERT